MGLSGLEPPTSRLSGVRSNRLSYKPIESGIHLLSHAVSSIVPSAAYVLTVVFGMGTGVSHRRIGTGIIRLLGPPAVLCKPSYGAALPKPFRKARQYSLSSIQSQENKFSCFFLSVIHPVPGKQVFLFLPVCHPVQAPLKAQQYIKPLLLLP